MPTSDTAAETALRRRVAAYPQTAASGDADATAAFLTDDFFVLFLHPGAQEVSRDEWLALLPDIETREYRVLRERITVYADRLVAVHHVLVHMETTMRGVERSGEFAMTDTWVRGADGEWLLDQRHSVPLAAPTLPV